MPFFKSSAPQLFIRKPVQKPKSRPVDLIYLFSRLEDLTPDQHERRVTIWHRTDHRKITGSAAPLRKNLESYLKKHLECDVFVGQDSWDLNPAEIEKTIGRRISDELRRVDIWNRVSKRRITGRASPLKKNLLAYLARNPNSEVYTGQGMREDHYHQTSKGQLRRILPKVTSKIERPTQTW